MNDCLTFSPSDKTLHRKGVFKSPPLKSYFCCCDKLRTLLCQYILFWIFQKSSLETGVWYNRTVPHTAHKPTIIPLDNSSGIFYGVRICDILHHIIHFTYFEHLVFNQMLFFVVSLLLILRLSTFCADEIRRCKRVYITIPIII